MAREVGRPLRELVLTQSPTPSTWPPHRFGVCAGLLLVAAVAAALALPSGAPRDA